MTWNFIFCRQKQCRIFACMLRKTRLLRAFCFSSEIVELSFWKFETNCETTGCGPLPFTCGKLSSSTTRFYVHLFLQNLQAHILDCAAWMINQVLRIYGDALKTSFYEQIICELWCAWWLVVFWFLATP